MLRDLHSGATIHILNRKERTVTQADVLQVTAPSPQFNMQVTPQGVMPPRQVMSMRLRWNGREVVFSNLYADLASSESTDGNGIVVCENEAALVNELKSSKANVDYLIEHRDDFEEQSKWYGEQLAMRDPERRAEAQNERQIEALKKEFDGMLAETRNELAELKSLLQQSLNKKGKD